MSTKKQGAKKQTRPVKSYVVIQGDGEHKEITRLPARDVFEARNRWIKMYPDGEAPKVYVFPAVVDSAGGVDGEALLEFGTIVARLKAEAAIARKGKADEKAARKDAKKANPTAEKALQSNYIQTFFAVGKQSPEVEDIIGDCYTEILQAIRDGKDIYTQYIEGLRGIDKHHNANRKWNKVTKKYFVEVYLKRGIAVVDTERALSRELAALSKIISPTQIKILKYMCYGKTNRQIQFIMDYKTVGTVTTHIQRLREKIRANFPTAEDFIHYVCEVYKGDDGEGDDGLITIAY